MALAAVLCAVLQGTIATWSVSASPALTIEDDGTPAKEFVRIEAVARLSRDRIAVVNGGTNEIRIFDARGLHLTTFGRTGGGPGEFRSIDWLGRSADTAWFFDFGQKRLTSVLLTAGPVLIATTRLTATSGRGPVVVRGRLPDGRWLVTTAVTPSLDAPPGITRAPGSIGLISPDGSGSVYWLGEFQGPAMFVHNPTGDIRNAAVGAIAFSPGLWCVAGENQVWIGDSGGDSLIVVRAEDAARRIVHLPISSQPPGRALIEEERARALETSRSPRGRSFIEARFSPRFLPDRLPYFGDLVSGPDGEVWVQEYVSSRTAPVRYVVIDAAGRARGRVSVPAGSRVREAGADYVLLLHEDEDGVQSVRLHSLERR